MAVVPDMSPGMVTLWWRAPEVLMRSNQYDGKKADVYSLGIILVESLTGVNPMHTQDVATDCKTLWDLLRFMGVPTEQECPGLWRQIHRDEKLHLLHEVPRWPWVGGVDGGATSGQLKSDGSRVAAPAGSQARSQQATSPAFHEKDGYRWSHGIVRMLRHCLDTRAGIFRDRQKRYLDMDQATCREARVRPNTGVFRGPAVTGRAGEGSSSALDPWAAPPGNRGRDRDSEGGAGPGRGDAKHKAETLGFSPAVLDLLQRMLDMDPDRRATAEEVARHPWFDELNEQIAGAVRGLREKAASEGTAGRAWKYAS